MIGQIAFNENSTIGKKLLNLINSSDEVTFKVDRNAEKEAVIKEIRQARKEAEKIIKGKRKGHSKDEILATI